jgi:hypothetical protein
VVNLLVTLAVDEYVAPVFRNVHTGKLVHGDFPKGVVNEVNYGGSVKAFAFLLNHHCCVSMDKARVFLSDLTNGELMISKGMVSGLGKEFSRKTEAERKKAFADLLLSPVMHVDFTGAGVNGQTRQVAVCATPETVLYFARKHKGHKGVKETPVEDYQGILVHDHDRTFYHYGSGHQECLAHVLRYLKDSMENEPNLAWSKQMWELLRSMIHYRNGLDSDQEPDSKTAEDFSSRYDEVLRLAGKEYEYEPPARYYRDGYNLYQRMEKFKESHLLFLCKKVSSTHQLPLPPHS